MPREGAGSSPYRELGEPRNGITARLPAMGSITMPIHSERGSATPSSYQSAMYRPTCTRPMTATTSVSDNHPDDNSARFISRFGRVLSHSGQRFGFF